MAAETIEIDLVALIVQDRYYCEILNFCEVNPGDVGVVGIWLGHRQRGDVSVEILEDCVFVRGELGEEFLAERAFGESVLCFGYFFGADVRV